VKPFCKSKKEYKDLLEQHIAELTSLQQLYYASNRYALLLIFQGIDSASVRCFGDRQRLADNSGVVSLTPPVSFTKCSGLDTLLEWCHGKSSCRWGNCEGLRVAGFDTRAKAVVRVGLPGGAPGSALLSRELVTVLPPPVGGLSRTLSGNQVGGREPSGCFGEFVRIIGGLTKSALIAVSDFVRYGTTRCQGLGHLQLARKRRHRQTDRLRD
jgi:hypothetical protein